MTSLESSFQQDINGDGTVSGLVSNVIEAAGSTQLTQVGNNYYLYNGGAGPSIKYAGTAITQGQFGAWTPIGAEQTATGYNVVLKFGSTDQYLVWTTNSNGNYISNTAPVSGSSSSLIALESSFQQDLNGDGTIGSGSAAATAGMSLGHAELFAQDQGTTAPAITGYSDQIGPSDLAHHTGYLDAHNAWHLI